MRDEQREAINRLRRGLDDIWLATLYSQEEMDKDIDTVLSLIKEQEKQIDLMAKYWNTGLAMCDNCDKIVEKYEKNNCENCIKQYFADLVEKE